LITAMTMVAKQIGANRVIAGSKIPHPCGDPTLSKEGDRMVRREIVECALGAIKTDVGGPTIFFPNITYTSG
jgi:glycine reductase complex component B subunit gamma